MKSLAVRASRWMAFLAALALTACAALLTLSAILAAWPFIRNSSQIRKMRAAANLATAGIVAAREFRPGLNLDSTRESETIPT